MRAAIGATIIGAGLLLAAAARAEEPSSARPADLLDWIDRTLAAGAEASAAPTPPPALGEGLVGWALGLSAEDERPAAPVDSAVPAEARPVAVPVAAVAKPPGQPDGAPLSLVGEAARAAAAQPGGGLLLPLN